MLIHYKGPQGLKQAGYKRILNWLSKRTRKDPTELVNALFDALQAQTVTVPGTEAAQLVIPRLAANIKAMKQQRDTIAEQVEGMLDDFPLFRGLDEYARGRHQDRSADPIGYR